MKRKFASHETDFYIRSLGYATLDSLEAFKVLYRSGARNNASAAGYANPQIDELIDTLDTGGVTYGRDARDLLAPVYEWLPHLIEANALLAKLA